MSRKICRTLSSSVLMLVVFAPTAMAATFTCPPPQNINCVPAIKQIDGWRDNRSQATGNTFGPLQ